MIRTPVPTEGRQKKFCPFGWALPLGRMAIDGDSGAAPGWPSVRAGFENWRGGPGRRSVRFGGRVASGFHFEQHVFIPAS
jgi:hypothetical protein